MQLNRFIRGILPLWAVVCFSCGGSTSTVGGLVPTGAGGAGSQHGDAGTPSTAVSGSGGAPGTGGGGATNPLACADIFDQGSLQTYSFDISDDQMAAINVEFHNLTALESGASFAVYHPITFHLNGETITNAAIKLHGQSSWDQTVTLDGDRAKMQFDVSFDQVDPKGSFHGVSKLVFDMPRDDWTFMHNRVVQAWLRQTGIMAPCSVSARLNINGTLLRPLRARAGGGERNGERVLSVQPVRRPLERGRPGGDQHRPPERRAPHAVQEREGSRLTGGDRGRAGARSPPGGRRR